VDTPVLGLQLLPGFFVLGIDNTGIDRADCGTLLLVMHGDAFGAFGGIDLIDLIAGGYGFVGALGLTSTAVDTFFRNYESHSIPPDYKNKCLL
jgi:hypothetical protein